MLGKINVRYTMTFMVHCISVFGHVCLRRLATFVQNHCIFYTHSYNYHLLYVKLTDCRKVIHIQGVQFPYNLIFIDCTEEIPKFVFFVC